MVLTIGREGTADFDVTITRRKFDLPLISWAMVPDTTIAMIRLDQFATGATEALKEAIGQAKDEGATGIVFDLRSNPGGYVNEAVGVASQFVGDGIVYQSFDRSGKEKDAKVQEGGLWPPTCRSWCWPTATRRAPPRSSRAPSRTRAGARSWARRRSERGRSWAVSTSRTARRCGSATERWLTRGGHEIWREGLEPDIKVALADNAQPVLPDALRDMTAAELRSHDGRAAADGRGSARPRGS